ncbi:cornifelin-like protein [Labeo rohita]|uniref:Cornifelin-like protein n=1 Tax=Labeo rohita TaxID=84645 RepID=A0A498MKB7_LABRO|nr:cornifelin-like protein [Labeo rohita]
MSSSVRLGWDTAHPPAALVQGSLVSVNGVTDESTNSLQTTRTYGGRGRGRKSNNAYSGYVLRDPDSNPYSLLEGEGELGGDTDASESMGGTDRRRRSRRRRNDQEPSLMDAAANESDGQAAAMPKETWALKEALEERALDGARGERALDGWTTPAEILEGWASPAETLDEQALCGRSHEGALAEEEGRPQRRNRSRRRRNRGNRPEGSSTSRDRQPICGLDHFICNTIQLERFLVMAIVTVITSTGQYRMAHTAVSVQSTVTANNMTNQWSSGAFDCCEDMGICCCGFWCTYCLMCKTSEDFGECHCLPLLEICFGGIMHPITLAMRSSMRERFHIKGSIQNDCCMATCCPACVWCQMARELKARRQNQVVVNVAVNTVHQQPQAFNQPPQAFNQPTQAQAINAGYQPMYPVNTGY